MFYCCELMERNGRSSNAVTFVFSLKACGSIEASDIDQEIHDRFVGNTLVDMYAKCGSLIDARHVFEKLHIRTRVFVPECHGIC